MVRVLRLLDNCGEKLETGTDLDRTISRRFIYKFYNGHYVGCSEFVVIARVVWIITSRGEEQLGIRGFPSGEQCRKG